MNQKIVKEYVEKPRNYYGSQLKTILKGEGLIQEQKEILLQFHKYLVTSKTRTTGTLVNTLYPVYLFGKYIKKPYNKTTKEDKENYLYFLGYECAWRGKNNSKNQMNNVKIRMVMFYKWLYQTDKLSQDMDWKYEQIKNKDFSFCLSHSNPLYMNFRTYYFI